MTPTPEQEAICQAVARGENCMVEALAGCAKSTTLRLAVRAARSAPLILAFNKKIKEEMEKELKAEGLEAKVLTMNGLGHQAITSALRRRPELDNDKIYKLSKEIGLKRDDLSGCIQLVRSARMAGMLPVGVAGRGLVTNDDQSWEALADDLDIDPILTFPARDVLAKSLKLAMQGTIDYDDQIYISTLLFGTYPKFDCVFVDEAQDLSPLNHLQVAKAARSQIVAVGDSHQAIYAWRGADHQSMEHLRALRADWTDLTLSMTFRCPKAVVARQRHFVPDFTAGPDNLIGSVENLKEWRPNGGSASAILCRNNAPLIKLAFRLLRAHIPVNYLGKDIGANMKRLYNKLSDHGKKSLDTTIANAWAYAKDNPEKLDKAESLVAILESSKSIDDAMEFLTKARTDSISLATGHKAKGLEWDTVYHLNPWLIPSKWVQEAKPDYEPEPGEDPSNEWLSYQAQLRQENNLRYVIETRTKDKLRFVNLENLQ